MKKSLSKSMTFRRNSHRTRFALRPQLHWAVQLQCPLCRIGGIAFVVAMPSLLEAAQAIGPFITTYKDDILIRSSRILLYMFKSS